MLWPKKNMPSDFSISCCLNESSYSLAVVTQDNHVLHSQAREFNSSNMTLIAKALADDVDRFNLIAHDCQLLLLTGQYQLIVMDAPDVPEKEMVKALRWNLKGLSDYDLDDVAIDAFMLPSVERDLQKKTLVALTPLSELNKRRAILESAFLNVTVVSIAEMALKNILALMYPDKSEKNTPPILMISLCNTIRKLHIVHNNMFYLIRELTPNINTTTDEPPEMANIILELERSIDYCVNKLELPEPKQILFTPAFHQAVFFFKNIEEALNLSANIIDLNQYMGIQPPLSLEEQNLVFYSIVGAINQGASQ